MSRRRSHQPPDRDDWSAVEHRRPQPDLATTDDVLGLDAASDDGAEAHGLFDGPGSVVQFGENLLTAAGRGFSQFGENVVTAVGAGAKEFLEQGAEAASNLAGRGQDDEDDEADNEGDGEGGGDEGGSAQHGPPAGGIAPVVVDIDVDDLFTSTPPDSGSAVEFASADIDDDLDDDLFSD